MNSRIVMIHEVDNFLGRWKL